MASIIKKKDQDPRAGGGGGVEVKELEGEVGVSSFKLRRLVQDCCGPHSTKR